MINENQIKYVVQRFFWFGFITVTWLQHLYYPTDLIFAVIHQ